MSLTSGGPEALNEESETKRPWTSSSRETYPGGRGWSRLVTPATSPVGDGEGETIRASGTEPTRPLGEVGVSFRTRVLGHSRKGPGPRGDHPSTDMGRRYESPLDHVPESSFPPPARRHQGPRG